jgi:hypothetical protein
MPSGLTTDTPKNLVLNVAVLYVGGAVAGTTVSGTKMGLTKGGLDFDPGIKERMVEADGLRAPISELEYRIDYDSRIKGKLIEFGTSQVEILEPGSTLSGSEIIPIPCGQRFAAGDYLVDVMAVWARGDGGLFVVKFANAKVMTWKVGGKDKQEAEIDIDLRASIPLADAAVSTDKAPYSVLNIAA